MAAESGEGLRLSRADMRALDVTATALAADEPPAALAYRHGADVARDAGLIRAATLATPLPAGLDSEIARGAGAVFPLRAADLSLSGPALGKALRALEGRWIASDFALDADALRDKAEGGRR